MPKKVIVRWYAPKTAKAQTARVNQILFGQTVVSKGKRYRYPGLYSRRARVGRGMIRVSEESSKRVRRVLTDLGVKYKVIPW